MDSGEEGWLERFSDLILQTQNVNVIRVDWRESSRQIDYTQAATDTQVSNFKITFIFTLFNFVITGCSHLAITLKIMSI